VPCGRFENYPIGRTPSPRVLRRRLVAGRYSTWPHLTDSWHLALSLFTIVLAIWTFVLTKRVVLMTRQLARGEFGEMDIRLHDDEGAPKK
jgi:hypothetical protein